MPHLRDLIARNPTDWLNELIEKYQISVVHDDQANPRLVSLKYNQIESPMHEPVVQECRGVVVDLKTNSILAHPYNKFWNMGEYLAAQVDWPTARVQEKLDGSLMLLYRDPNRYVDDQTGETMGDWRVASSGHPTAGGKVGKADATFEQLFWKTFSDLGMQLPYGDLAPETTFMFELMTADNRVVVRHDKPRLVLHGARHVPSELEWSRSELVNLAAQANWEIVKEYPISSADDALKAAEALDPLQTEGFVVVDGNHNRVKIKSPRYVALHHLKGEFSPRRAIELWQAGEVTELLGYFPEMVPDVQPICDALEQAAINAFNDYVAHREAPTRKDFAMAIKDKPWSAICFKLIGASDPTHETAKAVLRNLSVSACERLIGI